MSSVSLFFALFFLSITASIAAFFRALSFSSPLKLHSRPCYHGWRVFLFSFFPSLLVMLVWLLLSDIFFRFYVSSSLSIFFPDIPDISGQIIRNSILSHSFNPKQLFSLFPGEQATSFFLNFENYIKKLSSEILLWKEKLVFWKTIFIFLIFFSFSFYSLISVNPHLRARDSVERFIVIGLVTASSFAVFVALGILFSMLFETFAFFREVPPFSFFFSTLWDPRFLSSDTGASSSGSFGIIPLLAGTLYVALIALAVAVPVGLMSAIYMSEYSSSTVRSILKPILELLAGIPTIVYGIFALITLGPFLRDVSAFISGSSPFIEAQSIFTAGFTMGVMLVPVICSLSDDMIVSVPSMMREGSLALGATHSETIRNVVLPAAFPGIGGAILLAASRAIGETMIVVLAAGVAPNLTANPFEAMTTITVKIVNQLTGDLEFDSPRTLVAFALGTTLFFITFLMNILALTMLLKHRRRYE